MDWTGARYADKPTVQVDTYVDVAPALVWELVANPTSMPDLSDELYEVEWLDDAKEAAVGARFVGRSRHAAMGEWSTTSQVVEYEPERVFAWAVEDPDNPSAVWRFTLNSEGRGTRLTQHVQIGPGPSGLSMAIAQMPDKEQKIVFVRMREFERNMTKTLAEIKRRLDGTSEPAGTG